MSNNIKNLCYLINNHGEALLQFKRRGFGVGKWNGPGGKVETGEELEQAVIREVKEETGLEASDLKKWPSWSFIFMTGRIGIILLMCMLPEVMRVKCKPTMKAN